MITVGTGSRKYDLYFQQGGLQKKYFSTYETWTLMVPVNRSAFVKNMKINARSTFLMQNLTVDCDGDKLGGDPVYLLCASGES